MAKQLVWITNTPSSYVANRLVEEGMKIGKPMPTKTYSRENLEQMEVVGIYVLREERGTVYTK